MQTQYFCCFIARFNLFLSFTNRFAFCHVLIEVYADISLIFVLYTLVCYISKRHNLNYDAHVWLSKCSIVINHSDCVADTLRSIHYCHTSVGRSNGHSMTSVIRIPSLITRLFIDFRICIFISTPPVYTSWSFFWRLR